MSVDFIPSGIKQIGNRVIKQHYRNTYTYNVVIEITVKSFNLMVNICMINPRVLLFDFQCFYNSSNQSFFFFLRENKYNAVEHLIKTQLR